MHLRKALLPLFLYPFLALAAPEPKPAPPTGASTIVIRDDSGSGGLLQDLPDIVDGVKQLLDQKTLDNLETIIGGGATLLGGDTPKTLKKLLSSDNVDKLQDIVDNAHALLKPHFVNQTETLIDDATPVCFFCLIDWLYRKEG